MKITPGYRIGKLTVSADTGIRKNGYRVWLCSCDCGGSRQLDVRALQRGLIKDCGCETKVKPGQSDLTGMKFGRLTPMEPTKKRDINGVTIWHCRCDCGKETDVSAAQLKNGYKKSCGCLRPAPLEDYSGRVFGRLTVMESVGRVSGVRYWRCQCACGKETIVRHTYLRNGKTKSCGCFHAEDFREKMKYVDGTSVRILENAPMRLGSNNTSGHNGVYLNRKNRKWIAEITFKKKKYYLGSFSEIEDAVRARKEAEARIYGDFLAWYYVRQKEKEEVGRKDAYENAKKM